MATEKELPLDEFLSPSNSRDDWGEWKKREIGHGPICFGPTFGGDFHFENNLFSIYGGEINFEAGLFVHLFIIKKGGGEPRWRDKQRIKNELFGCDRVALEIMPRQDEIVGRADAYHIWIAPPNFKLPNLRSEYVRGAAEAGRAEEA